MLIYILKGPKCISVHWLVYNLLIVVSAKKKNKIRKGMGNGRVYNLKWEVR